MCVCVCMTIDCMHCALLLDTRLQTLQLKMRSKKTDIVTFCLCVSLVSSCYLFFKDSAGAASLQLHYGCEIFRNIFLIFAIYSSSLSNVSFYTLFSKCL